MMGDCEHGNHTVFISVGSNIGDKLLNCQNGVAALTNSGKSVVKAWSKFYKTEPVDYEDQDWFINAVVKIETILNPFDLLNELKTIEHNAGRKQNSIRFGPRTLDMDIILYDDFIINDSSGLQIPHPRMHKRCFVLKPFCDIDPEMVHPVLKKNMQYLLDNLDNKDQGVVELKIRN